uniref:Uncharacterized protein n=1 Tax=Anguilla anguilla TaxID=7936 RepID=A0A0E9TZT4_ANGAN
MNKQKRKHSKKRKWFCSL